MHTLTLHRRNLRHHWRAHLAVLLGVAASTAVLSGALLVGDSLRGSLRAAALAGLGRIAYAVQAPTYFREQLGDTLAAQPEFQQQFAQLAPAILIRASAAHANTRVAAHDISVLGIDHHFWQLGESTPTPAWPSAGLVVALNEPLADDLGARPGDDILLRVGQAAAISPEMLLGRRDALALTLRLTVDRTIPADGLGSFALRPRQTAPRNAYIPLAALQRALGQTGGVNTILIAADTNAATLQGLCHRCTTLADLGLKLRASEAHEYIALESNAFLLAPPVETAARAAVAALDRHPTAILAYLANTIAFESRPDAVIPYSTVAAIEPAPELSPALNAAPGEILLSDWAAADLDAHPGDSIRLTYYVAGTFGHLDTQSTTFRLGGVIPLTEPAADPGFTPDYPGVTDTDRLADWDPPFPIDLRQIRPKDEDYWREYRATPKAFVALADGQRLWAADHERFGRLTSLRVHAQPGEQLAELQAAFEHELLQRLDPARLGLKVEAVRARALAASQGTTDFAGLFLGFSFFLIASAIMLVALLFRLGVEQRATEVGLLLALGFRPQHVARLLLLEGAAIAIVGTGLGLLGAQGYAWLMLAGLRTWWSAATHAPFLRLHATWSSIAIGFVASLLISLLAIAWSLRGVLRFAPRALLAGIVQSSRPFRPVRSGISLAITITAASVAAVALGISLWTSAIAQALGFFVGGVALLTACLAALTCWLRHEPHSTLRSSDPAAILHLGLRNARRHAGRSLLTAGLIASATFVITALQAMRLTVPGDSNARDSGTGGFALLAESDVPLPYDLNTPAGRDALNLSAAAQTALADATCIPFRLRAGDEASCLNLYQPAQPRLLGVTDEMIERGGFAFAATLASSPEERRNPWTLLRRKLPDGVIPALADEAAARWQLHLNLGDELQMVDERGRDVRLRLVGLLKGSLLQGELLMAEPDFVRLFPSVAGYAYFLLAAPHARTPELAQLLPRDLTDFGFATTPTRRRLADLFAVQNTYLSTFQTLGGLGLLLGTIGLAAVLLRNVWERRRELALLRTLGFGQLTLGLLVLVENAFLVVAGLVAGLVSAAVVVAPQAAARDIPVPWASLLLMFGAILFAGLAAGAAALVSALRAPLLPALRTE